MVGQEAGFVGVHIQRLLVDGKVKTAVHVRFPGGKHAFEPANHFLENVFFLLNKFSEFFLKKKKKKKISILFYLQKNEVKSPMKRKSKKWKISIKKQIFFFAVGYLKYDFKFKIRYV